MAIQIFGTSKCFDTKKAERWFSERGVKVQLINIKEKGISNGELSSVISGLSKVSGGRAGAIEFLIDSKSKDYSSIAYLDDKDKEEKLLENPLLLKTPIVRNTKSEDCNGAQCVTVGFSSDIWKVWTGK